MTITTVFRALAIVVLLYVAYLIGGVLVRVALGLAVLVVAYWLVRRLLTPAPPSGP